MSQRLFVRLDEDAVQGPESTVPARTLRAYATSARLQPILSQMLHYREVLAPQHAVNERVIPDGATRLIVDLGPSRPGAAGRAPALTVIGPSFKAAMVRLEGEMDCISIALRPGAAELLLGVPAGDIAGTAVPLDALWGGPASDELLARLMEQREAGARVEILGRELERRSSLAPPRARRAAARAQEMLAAARARPSVRDMAAAVGLGERRLQQLFLSDIGMSPVAWRRLARLRACLLALRHSPAATWADLAAEGGFYDQSHLIHEFRDLCGCTPGDFRRTPVSDSSKTRAAAQR
ncbi:MAG: AraC family transcriptional regulator [Rhizobacter sp.]|nr:AraC family transcriptional regulator [Rhizobacter sp.]